ncbi:hypothetical protein P4562_01885 [Lysinibacillus xylanilyticus]|uniref:hypothetical protein n=1 Tax=Lysinibacillus xylanilyticus TaxID=582475 RepID=UPI002E1C05E9|nr:hypothetical protein [Lysinibacillus xylanilyticus]
MLAQELLSRKKAISITSCDNAFVTNIIAAAALLSRKKHLLAQDPAAKRMFSVRKRSANEATANVLSVRKRSDSKCFICAKAKRQQQQKRLIGRPQEALLSAKASTQPERKSTTRYGNEPYLWKVLYLLRIHIF